MPRTNIFLSLQRGKGCGKFQNCSREQKRNYVDVSNIFSSFLLKCLLINFIALSALFDFVIANWICLCQFNLQSKEIPRTFIESLLKRFLLLKVIVRGGWSLLWNKHYSVFSSLTLSPEFVNQVVMSSSFSCISLCTDSLHLFQTRA